MSGESPVPGRFLLDDFELYQLAREYRKKIYAILKQLPSDERYCLDKQMRRAVVSITNNIAEGHGRWHFQENIQYCRIARGSVDEIIDDLNVCLDQEYCDQQVVQSLKREGYELIRRINGYIAYLRRCRQGENEK
jgi:four helix bundle protein